MMHDAIRGDVLNALLSRDAALGLSIEGAKNNIHVNCLAPTYVRTALTEPLQKNEDFIIGTMGRSPTPRFGEAWELVGPAVFLASDASSYITSQDITVDGGFTHT